MKVGNCASASSSQHQSASVTGNQRQSAPVSIFSTSASSSFWSLFVLNLDKFTPDRICLPTPSVTNIRYVCGECVASSCAIINHHLPPSCQTHTDGFLIFEFHHFNLDWLLASSHTFWETFIFPSTATLPLELLVK